MTTLVWLLLVIPSSNQIHHLKRYVNFHKCLVDVLDLQENSFKTLPVDEVLSPDYPNIQVIASEDKGDYLQDIIAAGMLSEKMN